MDQIYREYSEKYKHILHYAGIMKKENVTISFESEQLAALEFSLKKKNTSVQAQLDELLKCLYESEVPEPVREYLDSRAAPAARPRRPARPAKPQPREEIPSALTQPTGERNGE